MYGGPTNLIRVLMYVRTKTSLLGPLKTKLSLQNQLKN